MPDHPVDILERFAVFYPLLRCSIIWYDLAYHIEVWVAVLEKAFCSRTNMEAGNLP